MFTYITLGSSDLERSARFYDQALAPLGISRCGGSQDEAGWEDIVGWGVYEQEGATELALWLCRPFDGGAATVGNGTMVALKADSWSAVRAFYQAALDNGGTSEGEPGLRPHYADDFFAAYVRDPDGNKLAAVCRGFTEEQATASAWSSQAS
ncbi:VOC family protein [Pseudomonas sp. OIL-1]|uniref:VOC family protein n=1 Tax=Pseudomonas sp. OIL-1 TaxID=2706126 RepID=UPI0013A71B49|nr:VOC family protein [Pseudomonas sp. OIL-1]QIB50621.1 VOC family protein [Pseudomonas sp. OIL-1]